jgi:hypothetical protein
MASPFVNFDSKKTQKKRSHHVDSKIYKGRANQALAVYPFI